MTPMKKPRTNIFPVQTPSTTSFTDTFLNNSIWRQISMYCNGSPSKDWRDGDTAAKAKHLDLLKSNIDLIYTNFSANYAAQNGDIEMLDFLHKSGLDVFQGKVLEHAALGGHIDVIEWLNSRDLGIKHSFEVMDNAAKEGQLKALEWLHQRNESCSRNAMNSAARNGHLHVVEWLQKERWEGCTSSAIDDACANGHLQTVEWLLKNRKERGSTDAMDGAAANGHLSVVKFLHSQKYPCSKLAMDEAARRNNLHVVEWLEHNRSEGCSRALEAAVENGNLQIVKFLSPRRATHRQHENLIAKACHRGYLEVVEYLHHWTDATCTTQAMDLAVSKGHLQIVEFLHKYRGEGCSKKAIDSAIKAKNIEMTEWLCVNGYSFGMSLEEGVGKIKSHGKVQRQMKYFQSQNKARQMLRTEKASTPIKQSSMLTV